MDHTKHLSGLLAVILLFACSNSVWAASRTARRHVGKGNIAFRQLDFAGALEHYDSAIEVDGDYAIAHSNRGLALQRLGRLEEATAALKKALELAPEKAVVQLNLSKVHAVAGQYELALQAADKALALDDDLGAAHYNRAWVLEETNRIEEAQVAIAAALDSETPAPGSRLLSAICAARAGDAAELFRVCLANHDDLPEIWRWLGKWNQSLATGGLSDLPGGARKDMRAAIRLASCEDFVGAREMLTVVSAAAPASAMPHWLAAMTYLLSGEHEAAEDAMAKAAERMPSVVMPEPPGKTSLWVDKIRHRVPMDESVLPGAHVIHLFRVHEQEMGATALAVVPASGAEIELAPPDLTQPVFQLSEDLVAEDDLVIPDVAELALGSAQLRQVQAAVSGDLPLEVKSRKTGIVFRLVPAGDFVMGSPAGEDGRYSDEKQHRVQLTKAFWMGKYEVTQAQYEALMGTNPSYFKKAGKNAPVERVSWDDAMAFCAKLTERERAAGRLPAGYEYRLPTEAEWEYACRAGTTTALNSGKDLTSTTGRCRNLDEVSWYDENSGSTTHPVGQKKPNAWGLYDMHGNVWEWCYDWYGDYDALAGTDPTGAAGGSSRVHRGGGWDSSSEDCRSASRYGLSPSFRYFLLGFRLVRAVQ